MEQVTAYIEAERKKGTADEAIRASLKNSGWPEERARSLITNDELSTDEADRVAEAVGVGAVKYALLKSSVGGNITFDFGQSVSFDGASGPYLQYVYARTCGVLAKSSKQAKFGDAEGEMNVAEYLFELAQRFNVFYNKHQVIGSEAEGFRLGLVNAVNSVMKRGLSLLGIKVVEKM